MSRNSLLLVLTCIAGLLFTNVSAQPFLRLETGLHYAKISKVASDASGKYLLTASYDKTARMWDAATGQLLKTFRVQIGEDNNGKLYSCSLSPDGQIAAVGGWDEKNTIYLIHTQTGNIIHTITDLPEVIFDLDFSKDGRYLAAGLGNEYGVRIYDTQSWSERAKLDEYKSSGAAVTFDSQGRLAVVGGEGQIRLYSASFTFTKEIPSPGNLQPEKVAFNPSGTLLAIAYTNGSKVEACDGYSLEKLYSPSVKRDNTDDGNLSSIAFSADGQSLYAGGSYAAVDSENKWKFAVRRWSSAGKGGYQDLLFFNNTIINFAPLPNGNLAVAGANPDLAVISGNNTIWHHISNENDYAITDVSHFKVNATGMALGFNSNNYEPQSFDLLTRTLVTETSYFPGPTSKNGGLEITDLKKTNGPLMNGKKASFVRSREQVFSADISSTGREAVFGTGWNLYKTDAAGTKVWSTALPETGWAVNISSNDKTVVVAMGDGTIRWYSMADGKELLAFYLRNDNKRWILFTPTGYYDAAPGAENFLGWHINNGFEKVPEFFPVSRFREQYYRPDVIDAILTTYNIDEAIKLANSRSQK
ncbi:MAG: peptidase C14, partial [Pedobacter sp.]